MPVCVLHELGILWLEEWPRLKAAPRERLAERKRRGVIVETIVVDGGNKLLIGIGPRHAYIAGKIPDSLS